MSPPPSVPAPPRRRRLAAAAFGIVAGLVIAEVLLRLTGFGSFGLRQMDYHFFMVPPNAYWEMDPGHPPEHRWDGDPYGRLPPGARMTYAINGAGLRGPLPAAGKPRVLVVGDSFTFGEGVGLEDTFCARLERTLAGRPPAPAVVNAGVPGYGTTEEAARFSSLLEQFAPKAVVVVFVPNDAIPFEENVEAPDLINAKPRGDEPPLRLLALAQSALGRAARDRAVEEWYLSFYAGEGKPHWDRTRSALAWMQAAARGRGASFGIAYFPLLHRLADRPLAPIRDAVASSCADLGVPFLDLTPALAVEGERALWVHPTDHHPNARAHELAAGALAPFVEELLR